MTLGLASNRYIGEDRQLGLRVLVEGGVADSTDGPKVGAKVGLMVGISVDREF